METQLSVLPSVAPPLFIEVYNSPFICPLAMPPRSGDSCDAGRPGRGAASNECSQRRTSGGLDNINAGGPQPILKAYRVREEDPE